MSKLFVLVLLFVIGLFVITYKAPRINKPEELVAQTTLLFTGDVMLGRSVNVTSLAKNDPTYPFIKVVEKMKDADLTIVNLENPIVENCPKKNDGMIFCADPQMIKGLTFAGVDVVSLANNHTLNYGKEGLEQTKKYLTDVNIDYADTHLATKKVNGVTFGFLGFEKSQLGNPQLSNQEVQLIKQANNQVDVLIVLMHWGVEYQNTALPGIQKLASELVDLGTDVIIGSHPHWVQNSEHINGVPVYYSLGNFVFDQMWSEETKKGLAVEITFEGKQIVKEKQFPVYIRQLGQPEWIKE
jgi:poly-gamma-glutamate capsule biosynthesis protein CapA/YwtB (metallophosphatase superfamily)